MTMAPYEGIRFGVSMDEYRKAPGICQSDLKEMDISPAHYLAKITAPPEPPTDAQRIGQVTHSILLDNSYSEFVVRPETYPVEDKRGPTGETKSWNGNSNWCKDWLSRQTKTVLTSAEWADIAKMAVSVQAHPMACKILYGKDAKKEVSIWKKDEETGLLLKGRCDCLTTDAQNMIVIPDLKTVPYGGAGREEFSRSIEKWSYDLQSAFYLDLFGASHFVFVVVEKEPPYAVACYYLDSESIFLGRLKYRVLLDKVKQCQDRKEWPSYGEGLAQISVPDWVKKKEL